MTQLDIKAQNEKPFAARWRERGNRGFMAGFAFLARSLQQISTFVITLLAARFLMPEEYGIYSLGIVFVTLAQTMTYTGFYHFVVTSKAEDEAVLSTSFWMIVGVAAAAALAMVVLAYPIAWLYEAPELAPVLILLMAIQPLAGAGAWSSAALLRRQSVNLHFTIMFLQNLVALVGGILLLWLWQSLYALVAFRYLRVVSGTILFAVFGRDVPRFRFDRSLMREATVFSGHLYGSRFLNFLSRYAGDLLLGLMFSPAAAGLYRFGNRVATGATDIITQPLQSFALTQFGAAGRADRDMSPLLRRFMGTTVLLTGGVAATIVVLSPAVVDTFFKPAYQAALAVTYALAVRAVLGLGVLLIEPVMASAGKTGAFMRFNFVWTFIFVAIALAASPFGLTALAWSQALATVVSTAMALRLVQKTTGVSAWSAVRAFAVASAVVIAYGIALTLAWHEIVATVPNEGWAIVAGLGAASLLGLVALAAGWRLRIFSLSVFSG